MRQRRWTHHLRLLPGGASDVSSGIALTLSIYVALGFVGLIAAAILSKTLQFDLEFVSVFSLANALPCTVIGTWTGLRVRNSKHIGEDEVAVDLKRTRVFYGDEVGRAPRQALVIPVRPRQTILKLSDHREARLFYRANPDPEDLYGLARRLRGKEGFTLEDYVQEYLDKTTAELLPDPDGVREAVGEDLLKRGIVVTRMEMLET